MPEAILFAIGAVLTVAVLVAVWLVGLVEDGETVIFSTLERTGQKSSTSDIAGG